MNALERAAIVCVGLAVACSVWVAARATQEPLRPDLVIASSDPHGLARAAGLAARQGIDPLRPPGLPSGASIDPETGFLIGLGLHPRADEHLLSWRTLSTLNGVEAPAQIPADLLALDGLPVLLAGFLMPLYKLRDIHEFALVGSHYSCCFQRAPGLGDQIIVHLRKGETGLALQLEPLAVRGVLRVRPLHEFASGEGRLLSLLEIEEAQATTLD